MKTFKIAFLCTLTIALSVLTGCKKCATCTQTITTTVNVSTPGYPQTSKTTFEACGDELGKVDGKTTTSTSSSGGITATATAKTVCK
jgi:hypothetical protein